MTMVNPGTTNLVSWWPLEESSGTRNDSHGTNHLTDNNTVLYGTGIKGNAGDWEKDNNESLSKTDSASLSLTGSLTIGCWIKIESMPAVRCGLMHKFTGVSTTSGYGIYLETISGSTYLHFHVGGGGMFQNVQHSTALSTGVWYFVYGQWDDANRRLHVGVDAGARQSSGSSVSTLADNASAIVLGGTMTGGSYYDGMMDEPFLFNTFLGTDNIEWLYNGGSGRTYTDFTATPIPVFQNSYRQRKI